MIFAEIDPIEKTMNSWQNHEFMPPDRKPNKHINKHIPCDADALIGIKEHIISMLDWLA